MAVVLDSTTQNAILPAGYYGEINISTTLNPTGTVAYIYHHHVTEGDDIHADDSLELSGNLADDYQASSSGGCFTQVVYKQHSHSSSCYGVIGNTSSGMYLTSGGYWKCRNCSHTCGDGGDSQTPTNPNHYCTGTTIRCGKTAGVRYESEGIDYYARSCGITDGTIVGAKITY